MTTSRIRNLALAAAMVVLSISGCPSPAQPPPERTGQDITPEAASERPEVTAEEAMGTTVQVPAPDASPAPMSEENPDIVHTGPTVKITTDPCTVGPGESATLTAEVSYPESGLTHVSDDLVFDWKAPAGWSLEGSGAKVSVTAPAEVSPLAEVLVTVTDGGALRMEARARVRMEPGGTSPAESRQPALPAANLIQSARVSPNPVTPGGTMEIGIEFSAGADPDTLEFVWQVPGDWQMTPIDGGRGASLVAPSTGGERGEVLLRVRSQEGEAEMLIPVATSE